MLVRRVDRQSSPSSTCWGMAPASGTSTQIIPFSMRTGNRISLLLSGLIPRPVSALNSQRWVAQVRVRPSKFPSESAEAQHLSDPEIVERHDLVPLHS